jgi:hypothetical protein
MVTVTVGGWFEGGGALDAAAGMVRASSSVVVAKMGAFIRNPYERKGNVMEMKNTGLRFPQKIYKLMP